MITARDENLKNHLVSKEDDFVSTKDQPKMAEDIRAIIPTESLIEIVKVPMDMFDEYFVPFFIKTIVLPKYLKNPEREMNDDPKKFTINVKVYL